MRVPRVLTEKAARAEGYRSMTQPYALPDDSQMLASVVADMRRADADIVLVETGNEAVEVWRK